MSEMAREYCWVYRLKSKQGKVHLHFVHTHIHADICITKNFCTVLSIQIQYTQVAGMLSK